MILPAYSDLVGIFSAMRDCGKDLREWLATFDIFDGKL